MAPPPNSQEDRAAFIDACIKKRKKALQVWELLGLTSERTDDSQRGIFVKKEANELQEEIEQIAKPFATSYRGKLKELKSYLADENAFSDDVSELGKKYGADIWGPVQDGEICSPGQSQRRRIKEHDWYDARDRNNIRFYIRCWIICIVMAPRRGKGKGRARESGASGDQQNQAVIDLTDPGSPVTPGVSFRAPEPPRMYPTPEPRREATSTSANDKTSSTFLSSVTHAKSNTTTTPSKRKAHDAQERAPARKLPKPSQSVRTVPVFTQQQRDTYSIPNTCPPFPNPDHSLFGRRRETTYDTDRTWMPRDATADTETVADGEEVHAGEVDLRLQDAIAMANEQEMQCEYEHESAAGPSGTYRNALRQDSVIPNNTQTQYDTSTQHPSGRPDQDENTENGAYNEAITHSLFSNTEPTDKQTRTYRVELFKLLISYLDGINQFSPSSHVFAPEERMNYLLDHLQCTDAETWHSNRSDGATRFRLALQTWMSMRHRLNAFRSATGYFGQPGQQWEEFLRGLDNVPHAEAVLAFVELKDDGGLEEGRGFVTGHGFDEDLMVVFHGLTRVNGCNGPEVYKSVKKFNKGLLKWFEEWTV